MARSSSYGIVLAAILAALWNLPAELSAEPMQSPTWGFSVDLPEGYAFTEGDGKSRFAFSEETGKTTVNLLVYEPGRYDTPDAAVAEAAKKLSAKADTGTFDYRGKKAALARLSFMAPSGPSEGWVLAVELPAAGTASGSGASQARAKGKPILLALAYGPQGAQGNEERELSALDSISPTASDLTGPGPISVFSYPKTGTMRAELPFKGGTVESTMDGSDAEASKALVDREYRLLTTYASSPLWQAAWKRFYRAIWRDAYERMAGISFSVERAISAGTDGSVRALAEGVLSWVQTFSYERDRGGSDFIDLTTAATSGKGDCDSRALLAAIVLQHADVDAILMVSRDYAHAMAGIDVEGTGARFTTGNTQYVVAETTAKVALGRIGQSVSDPDKWMGIDFPSLPRTK